MDRRRGTAEQPDPIPRYLSNAFREVLGHFESWSPSAPEITVRINGRHHSMSEVCALMDTFRDELPQVVFDKLWSYIHLEHVRLREKVGADPTYEMGGYCLLKLIEERKADHKRREEEHLNRQ